MLWCAPLEFGDGKVTFPSMNYQRKKISMKEQLEEAIGEIGGEPLRGSGFEREMPQAAFSEIESAAPELRQPHVNPAVGTQYRPCLDDPHQSKTYRFWTGADCSFGDKLPPEAVEVPDHDARSCSDVSILKSLQSRARNIIFPHPPVFAVRLKSSGRSREIKARHRKCKNTALFRTGSHPRFTRKCP
jgi:hypothetical protein